MPLFVPMDFAGGTMANPPGEIEEALGIFCHAFQLLPSQFGGELHTDGFEACCKRGPLVS